MVLGRRLMPYPLVRIPNFRVMRSYRPQLGQPGRGVWYEPKATWCISIHSTVVPNDVSLSFFAPHVLEHSESWLVAVCCASIASTT